MKSCAGGRRIELENAGLSQDPMLHDVGRTRWAPQGAGRSFRPGDVSFARDYSVAGDLL